MRERAGSARGDEGVRPGSASSSEWTRAWGSATLGLPLDGPDAPLRGAIAPLNGNLGSAGSSQDGITGTVSRQIYTLAAVAAALAVTPGVAMADPGVLLSGYAPPGAGEEGILGTATPSASAHSGASSAGLSKASRGRSAMPLAQATPMRITARPVAGVAVRAKHSAHRTTRARQRSSPAHRTRPTAALPTASPAIIAAASRQAPGPAFTTDQGLLALALALITLGLALTWRRQAR